MNVSLQDITKELTCPRFVEVLSEWKNRNLLGVDIKGCLATIIKKLSAQSGELEFRFKYFFDKKSPVTKLSSLWAMTVPSKDICPISEKG